jgi:hypothetical protein
MSYRREEDQTAFNILSAIFWFFIGTIISVFVVAAMWDISYTQMIKHGFTTYNGVIYVVEPMKHVAN